MENETQVVTVFGGSGFVGTQIVQLLARAGYRVRVAVRRPDLAGHVKPLGGVGQVMPIQANVRDLPSVTRAVRGADAVINLVGIGYEAGKQRFDAVHVAGAGNIARAAAAEGVRHLVHMSALGADAHARSRYSESKAAGEAAVLAAFPTGVIMRPSVIFGTDDSFFNLHGRLARQLPILPVIGAKARLQPVYVGDVAAAFVAAAEGKVAPGTYELGGPETVTNLEIAKLVLRETARSNPLLPIGPGPAKALAFPLTLLPFAPLVTPDQVESLQADNVVSEAARAEHRTFEAFGISPTAMEAILPSYLWRFRPNGQFTRMPA